VRCHSPGDVNFAYDAFRKFLERVDERIKTVDELLPTQQDFTIDEQIVKEHDAAQYPRNPAEPATCGESGSNMICWP